MTSCRALASPDAGHVRYLVRGDAVQLVGRDGDWAAISYGGQQCWVPLGLLSDDTRRLNGPHLQRISTSSSDMVGWSAIVSSNWALVRPALTAIAAAWRISGASGPIMCRPTTLSVLSSTTNL